MAIPRAKVKIVEVSAGSLAPDRRTLTVLKDVGPVAAEVGYRVLRLLESSRDGQRYWQVEDYRNGTYPPPKTLRATEDATRDVARLLHPEYDPHVTPTSRWLGAFLYGPGPQAQVAGRNCTVVTSSEWAQTVANACGALSDVYEVVEPTPDAA
jgi:hypothetical protein